jgi:DNA modification methylase
MKLLLGDCFELIKNQPDNSVDLVITSPPYSDIVNYGKNVSTKKPGDYCDWILPLFREIHRVLKPSGSFILNINDKCEGGYRSTYIYELISRNDKETPLKLYDTYIWHKKNGIPNGGAKRFRNNTEFIFHFCKDAKQMKFYMDRVLEEATNSTKERMKYDVTDQGEIVSGKRVKNKTLYPRRKMVDGQSKYIYVEQEIPEKVRPDNVFRFPTAGSARDNLIKHPAPFHKELPLYFINYLTDEGDVVLDPFSGIATTGLACKEFNRDYIGYELNETYNDFAKKRLNGILDENWVVNQYTLDGQFIKSYPNRSAAGKETGLCEEDIMRCYRGNRITVGNYIWKLERQNDTTTSCPKDTTDN